MLPKLMKSRKLVSTCDRTFRPDDKKRNFSAAQLVLLPLHRLISIYLSIDLSIYLSNYPSIYIACTSFLVSATISYQ